MASGGGAPANGAYFIRLIPEGKTQSQQFLLLD